MPPDPDKQAADARDRGRDLGRFQIAEAQLAAGLARPGKHAACEHEDVADARPEALYRHRLAVDPVQPETAGVVVIHCHDEAERLALAGGRIADDGGEHDRRRDAVGQRLGLHLLSQPLVGRGVDARQSPVEQLQHVLQPGVAKRQLLGRRNLGPLARLLARLAASRQLRDRREQGWRDDLVDRAVRLDRMPLDGVVEGVADGQCADDDDGAERQADDDEDRLGRAARDAAHAELRHHGLPEPGKEEKGQDRDDGNQ